MWNHSVGVMSTFIFGMQSMFATAIDINVHVSCTGSTTLRSLQTRVSTQYVHSLHPYFAV